ncbi:hypothetical protein HYS91_04210 [Candidatus Daviesbacteria bacterium]|nr:hypothetical protein [Candidatus Daviesbacteria bacterium]
MEIFEPRLASLRFSPSDVDPSANKEFLRARYGVMVETGAKDEADQETAIFEPLDLISSIDAIMLLREELIKYPPSYVLALGVASIRLVADLQITKSEYYEGLHRVGGAAYSNGQLYVVYYERHRVHTRETIHHELEHLAQDRDEAWKNKIAVLRWICEEWREGQWDGLNRSSGLPFLGEKYWRLSNAERQRLDHSGFVKPHSRLSRREDGATVAGRLMTNPQKLLIQRRCDDQILYQKALHMVGMFNGRTSGKMGGRFFRELEFGFVRESYWR